jgi:uncharacterized protein with HEPN domain
MKKDDRLYLIHIGECIARVEEFTAAGRQSFMASRLIQDAVLRNLQTLTESSQRLSAGLKDLHPEINWRKMAGFRNVLVHNYLEVDLAVVWQIIAKDLAGLKKQVESLLQEQAEPARRRKKSPSRSTRKKKKK